MLHPDAPPGKSTKYARPERERRFLLTGVPEHGVGVRTALIHDRYIHGTRLRLRRSEVSEGAESRIELKLTQKIPSHDGGPGLITTMYLSPAEFEAFCLLPADTLDKTRLSIPPLGVDVFTGTLRGLVLAEAEFGSDAEAAPFRPPSFAVAEVTNDVRFAGGSLVRVSREELAETLRGFELQLSVTEGS